MVLNTILYILYYGVKLRKNEEQICHLIFLNFKRIGSTGERTKDTGVTLIGVCVYLHGITL